MNEQEQFFLDLRTVKVPMRVGRKLGRTLYLEMGDNRDDDIIVGIMDLPEVAAEVCRRWNAAIGVD